jgi:hypothetical protein
MSLLLPSELAWVLNLLGFNWPEADEDKLVEAAQHWRDFAAEVGHIMDDANRHATQVRAENTGLAIEAFGQYWEGIGGPGGHLIQARQSAEVVADVLDGFAAVVVAVKAAVIVQLGILAAELTATTVGAVFTFGAAEAAAPAEVAVTRIAVREIIDRIVTHIEEEVAQKLSGEALQVFRTMLTQALRRAAIGALKGAVVGGTVTTAMDLGWQEVRINVLHDERGLNLGELGTAAAGGAAGGAATGALHGVLHGGGPAKDGTGLKGGGTFGDNVEPYNPTGPIRGQSNPDSCVAGSCRMVHNSVTGDDMPEAMWRDAAQVDSTGGRLSDAANALSTNGVPAKVNEGMTITDLANATAAGPAIASGGGHALVVDKVAGGMVYIRDPEPYGIGSSYAVPADRFTGWWNGRAVVVGK